MIEETRSNRGPVCPFCQHLHVADEAFFYEEEGFDYDCHSCEQSFRVAVYTRTTWTSSEMEPKP